MLLFVLLVAVGSAGCGGDTRRGESETTTTGTAAPEPPAAQGQAGTGRPVIAAKVTNPARRAYVARVDSICRRLDPERGKEQARVGESARPEEAVRAYDDTIALGWRELRQIEAIPTPPGEHELLRANVFDVIRRQLAIRRQISSALAETNVPQLRRLRAELDNLSRSLGGFARGYGFQVCGED
jgi:hypothetical protein